MIVCNMSVDCSELERLLPRLKSQPEKGRTVLAMLEEGRSKELFSLVIDPDQTNPGHYVFKFVPTDFLTLMLVSVDC